MSTTFSYTISGDTYGFKNVLKSLNAKWSKDNSCWLVTSDLEQQEFKKMLAKKIFEGINIEQKIIKKETKKQSTEDEEDLLD